MDWRQEIARHCDHRIAPALPPRRLRGEGRGQSAYWGLALYVSVLWAVFFYYVFPAPRITLRNCVICFFTTGIVSIAVLLMAYEIPPLSWLIAFTSQWRSLPVR